MDKSGGVAFAALPSRAGKSTAVVRIDLRDYTVRQAAEIVDSIQYQWLAVDQRSGRVFVASDFGFRIAVVDTLASAPVLRFDSKRDWAVPGRVKWFDLSPDEDRLYVSYHGDRTGGGTGVDWLDMRGSKFVACNESILTMEGVGCGGGHGRVQSYGRGVVAATGEMLVIIDSTGTKSSRFPTGLPMNHFMEFALDANSKSVYAIASCPYSSGLSRVSLETPDTPGVRLPPVACGLKIVVSRDGKLLAVMYSAEILILDARTGAVVRTIKASAGVLDLMFVGPTQ